MVFPPALPPAREKPLALWMPMTPDRGNDLGCLQQQFGLPACTTANGCFTKVNQTGRTRYPSTNAGWALEISLDIEWAHAIAPGAKILLVEAKSASFTNLLTAEDYASAHANYVSNSWGGSEFSGENSLRFAFCALGRCIFRCRRGCRASCRISVCLAECHFGWRHPADLQHEWHSCQ